MVKTKSAPTPIKVGSKIGVLSKLSNFRANKKLMAVVVIIVITAVLLYFKTGWFIAATVNGTPITNFELLNRINKQYRQPVLTQLINEKIIKSEIQKSGVSVSASDVDKRILQIELSVGGAAALDNLLFQQGQIRSDLSEQIKLQLGLEKLYEKEATVSADEIADYVDKNKSQLSATDSAGQRKEAEETLRQQKLSQVFGEKFEELRTKAKVTIY